MTFNIENSQHEARFGLNIAILKELKQFYEPSDDNTKSILTFLRSKDITNPINSIQYLMVIMEIRLSEAKILFEDNCFDDQRLS